MRLVHAIKTSDFTLEAIYVVDENYIGIKLRLNKTGVWYARWYGLLPDSISEMEFLINPELLEILDSALLEVDVIDGEDEDQLILSIEQWFETGMPNQV